MWYLKEFVHQIRWRIGLLLNADKRRNFKQAEAMADEPFIARFWITDDGYHFAQDLNHPECTGQGKSYAEAAKWLHWCRRDWFHFMIDDGEPITQTRSNSEYCFFPEEE